ncbi:Rhs family protein, partial [mine drainage metagenome]
SGGGVQSVTTSVAVTGNLKLGRYTVTYQDMSIPVAGLPLQVLRTYDSYQASTSGDFGYGWHVSVADFTVSSNRPLGEGGWSEYPTSCIFGFCFYAYASSTPHFVTVTWPDGHSEVFNFTPQAGSVLLYTQGT